MQTTQSYVSLVKPAQRSTVWASREGFTIALLVVIACSATATISQTVFPRRETITVHVPTFIEDPDKLVKMLKESWGGVLHIKDNLATTVRYKRAALGNKNGFEDLPNGEYKILVYLVYQNATHGVFCDNQNHLWPFVWNKGTTDPPSENPGTIRVTAKRIEVVGAQ